LDKDERKIPGRKISMCSIRDAQACRADIPVRRKSILSIRLANRGPYPRIQAEVSILRFKFWIIYFAGWQKNLDHHLEIIAGAFNPICRADIPVRHKSILSIRLANRGLYSRLHAAGMDTENFGLYTLPVGRKITIITWRS
jgi:hypothetical protein